MKIRLFPAGFHVNENAPDKGVLRAYREDFLSERSMRVHFLIFDSSNCWNCATLEIGWSFYGAVLRAGFYATIFCWTFINTQKRVENSRSRVKSYPQLYLRIPTFTNFEKPQTFLRFITRNSRFASLHNYFRSLRLSPKKSILLLI